MSSRWTRSAHALSRRFFAGGLALCCLGGLAGAQGAAPERATLIELFTSQGCSSCPPADALMLRLADEGSVIPVTFSTEIWDYLGWKDTLAKPSFTRRHKAYAAGIANKRVYTPQAIVNGRAHCVGSDLSALTRLKRSAVSGSDNARFAIQRSGRDWDIKVTRSGATPARLILLPLRSRQAVEIQRGENMGKVVTYANVVRDIIDLGPVAGGTMNAKVTLQHLAGAEADSFVVLVQAGSLEAPGEVFGAVLVGPGQS